MDMYNSKQIIKTQWKNFNEWKFEIFFLVTGFSKLNFIVFFKNE